MFPGLSSGSHAVSGGRAGIEGKGEIKHRWRRRHHIHSVNKHSLSTYYVPGVILDAGVTAMDKTATGSVEL